MKELRESLCRFLRALLPCKFKAGIGEAHTSGLLIRGSSEIVESAMELGLRESPWVWMSWEICLDWDGLTEFPVNWSLRSCMAGNRKT